jgi:hypothetical protein
VEAEKDNLLSILSAHGRNGRQDANLPQQGFGT